MQGLCIIENCGREVFVKKTGWCQSHYLSARKNGGIPKVDIRQQTTGADKEAALLKLGWKLREPYPGDKDKRWKVICPNSHEVTIRWGTFSINSEPCKQCRHPSLADTHPNLLDWWDFENNGDLTPSTATKGMDVQITWRCPLGHRPKALISSMARKDGPGCGICSGHQVVRGVNDLESQFTEAISFWDWKRNVSTPDQVFYRTQQKLYWVCSNQHSFHVSAWQLKQTLQRGVEGCKYCANRDVLQGWNDLRTVAPHLVEDFIRGNNDKPPEEVLAFESQDYLWQCEKMHAPRLQSPSARVRRSSGCSVCANIKTESGFNDALTVNPVLADTWDEIANGPLEILANTARTSAKSFRWKCLEQGHSFTATVTHAVRGVSCAVCGNRELLVGFNDLASSPFGSELDLERTRKSAVEFGWSVPEIDPLKIIVSEARKVWWRCPSVKNHFWDTSPKARKSQGSGCPYCSGNRLEVGRNDLLTKFPEMEIEWSPLNSLKMNEIPVSYKENVHWKCLASKGHPDYLASPHARTGVNTTGCPDCNTGGFETSKPAYLYFIEHESFDACKIGISNVSSRPNRLTIWQTKGWKVIQVWEDSYGAVIKDTEQQVLRKFIREVLALPQALTKDEMGGNGQAETFPRVRNIQSAVSIEITRVLGEKQDYHQGRLMAGRKL